MIEYHSRSRTHRPIPRPDYTKGSPNGQVITYTLSREEIIKRYGGKSK